VSEGARKNLQDRVLIALTRCGDGVGHAASLPRCLVAVGVPTVG
jgi:hypothetical protein